MQTSTYQANRQQLLMMGSTIFVSVTAAVIVSTLLIMTLMRGEIASALSSNVQTSTPVSQVASTCTAPQNEQVDPAEMTSSVTPVEETASEPFMPAHYGKHATPSLNNSFNSTNVSNITTTNNVSNTELHKTTVIKDSFNDNSKNSHNTVVVKDNEVNIDSNNTKNINSNNKIDVDIDKTVNNITKTDNSHSNNVIIKDNDVETHVLSDNKVIAPIVPILPVVPTV